MAFFPFRLIKDKTQIDFMGIKWFSIILTFSLLVASFISLGVKGLNFGIDFTGGVLVEAKMEQAPDIHHMRELLVEQNLGEISITTIGSDNDLMIRVGNQKASKDEQMQTIEKVKSVIAQNFTGNIDYRKIDFVGPQVGSQLITNGILAAALSLLGIMGYIWARFEWQYGVGVIIALFHDAVISLGFMSFTGLEFNIYSIAAVLTVIGFSVNDSVVIYDRIRENMRKYKSIDIEPIINISINETLSRTTLTVLTTLLSVLALILFGGEVIFSFSATVFFGIMVGTYSSIYVSAPILSFMKLKNKVSVEE